MNKKKELEAEKPIYASVRRICELFGLKPTHVYKMGQKKEIAVYKVGKKVMFKIEDFENYFAKCRLSSTDELLK